MMGFVRRRSIAKARPVGRPRVTLASLEREVRRRVEAILEQRARALSLEVEELVQRLGPGRLEEVLDRIDWEDAWEAPLRDELSRITREVMIASGSAELDRVGRQLRVAVEIDFNIRSPRVMEHTRAYVPELVREVTRETQEALRDRMRAGFQAGKPPREIAREMRSVVGLTTRQAAGVADYRERLVSRGLPDGEVDRLTARQHQRQVARRAMLISRTETIRAYNTGQQAAWEDAEDEGLILGDAARRFWISSKPVTEGGRTCEVCDAIAAHNHRGVGLHEPFRLPGGGTIEMPPAHPACRCSVGLRFQ